MLNALSVLLQGGSREGAQRAADSMRSQGFLGASPRFEWAGGLLETWVHPSQRNSGASDVRAGGGMACCVGPLWYRGRFGRDGLRALLRDMGAGRAVDETRLRGNFALFTHTRDQCLLMNDLLGLVRIYTSPDGLFHSTSWLATCAYAGGVEVDEAAAAEYVLLGASHSECTVARGVTTLPLAHVLDLGRGRMRSRLHASAWDLTDTPFSFDAAVDDAAGFLRTASQELVAAFPGRTRAALSGGFDSRLIVAGLMACGEQPALFVYGSGSCRDVAVARAVARHAGLSLDVIDKAAMDRGRPGPDMACLVANALFFDGLPNDGIHDAGSDRLTRLQQTADGRIALNGGGGEIFRNYFHLPDRPFETRDVVRTFFRGFDPGVFRRAGALAGYEERLAGAMRKVLGVEGAGPGPRLARHQVERLYPLFRCHYWMAVNNSVAVRHGPYATPLLDFNTVRLAWRLPLAWKNAGRLESELVARLHYGMASQPSAHGFRFSEGPDWRARAGDWATRMRPVAVRPFVNAVRRRLHGLGVAPRMLAHCRALLPGEWRLDGVLDLARLPDNTALSRALAVEVAWRELVS